MAQVANSVHQHIDIVLVRLLNAWQYLPAAINEIDDWDIVDQIVYVEEWSPDEQLLAVLHKYDQDGALTTDQSARYQELLALVEKNRPLLNDLRESD
jgi:hypothetical protein